MKKLTGPRIDAFTFGKGIGTSPTSITTRRQKKTFEYQFQVSSYLPSANVLMVDDCSTTA